MKSIKEYMLSEGLIKKKTMPLLRTGEYKLIDLGLPSGTLWADKNIGADNPEDCGAYFSFAETETRDSFSRDTYKYFNLNGNGYMYTKYNMYDKKKELENVDDAVFIQTQKHFCMPTVDQFKELIDEIHNKNIISEITKINNNTVMKLTSKKTNQVLILPLAGKMAKNDIRNKFEYGFYWSKTLLEDPNAYTVYQLFVEDDNYITVDDIHNRSTGRTLRGVKIQ